MVIWTNTFSDVDEYILQFRQIYFNLSWKLCKLPRMQKLQQPPPISSPNIQTICSIRLQFVHRKGSNPHKNTSGFPKAKKKFDDPDCWTSNYGHFDLPKFQNMAVRKW